MTSGENVVVSCVGMVRADSGRRVELKAEVGKWKAEIWDGIRTACLLTPVSCLLPPLSGRGVVQKSAVTLRQRVESSRLPTKQKATFAPRKKIRHLDEAVFQAHSWPLPRQASRLRPGYWSRHGGADRDFPKPWGCIKSEARVSHLRSNCFP